MAEYIEREALRSKAVYMHGFGNNKYVPLRAIEDAPAADVVPVVHGDWNVLFIDKEGKTNGVECSKCNAYFELDLFSFGLCFNYCPNCGAHMKDGE